LEPDSGHVSGRDALYGHENGVCESDPQFVGLVHVHDRLAPPPETNTNTSPTSRSMYAEAAQLDQLTIRQRLAHELNERKAAIPSILDALVAKAQKGDVPAARELRGWFDQVGKAGGCKPGHRRCRSPLCRHDPGGTRTLARRTD
jgi:hypothetical protein